MQNDRDSQLSQFSGQLEQENPSINVLSGHDNSHLFEDGLNVK